MLVLSRSPGDSIVVDENIAVNVPSIYGKYLKLGIKALEDVKVVRAELLDPLPPKPNRAPQNGFGSSHIMYAMSEV